ncbi:hypothetical protein E3P99_02199 [Wallemia hederae]|uniref:Uncharacterized protein n=1 Tax=Wallemia hederae TaxID=1540922 RepID=A0A4V4LT79_9BASI|nr:hypothetical protein E3P99_02199 [Wallemia hederae]
MTSNKPTKPVTRALELLPNLLSLNVSELLNYRHSILVPRSVHDYLSWNPSMAVVEHLREIGSDEALNRVPAAYKYEEDGQYVKFELGPSLYMVLKEEGENEWKYHDLQVVDDDTRVRNGHGGWYTNQDIALDAFIIKAEQLIREANDKTGEEDTEAHKEQTANQDFWADFSDDSDAEKSAVAVPTPKEMSAEEKQKEEDAFYTRQAEQHVASVDSAPQEESNSVNSVENSTKTAIQGVWQLYKQAQKEQNKNSKTSTTLEESFLELVLQCMQ